MISGVVATLATLFAADRQSVIILAFWTLVGAGVFVSVGAFILLRREGRPQEQTHNVDVENDADVEEPAGT